MLRRADCAIAAAVGCLEVSAASSAPSAGPDGRAEALEHRLRQIRRLGRPVRHRFEARGVDDQRNGGLAGRAEDHSRRHDDYVGTHRSGEGANKNGLDASGPGSEAEQIAELVENLIGAIKKPLELAGAYGDAEIDVGPAIGSASGDAAPDPRAGHPGVGSQRVTRAVQQGLSSRRCIGGGF